MLYTSVIDTWNLACCSVFLRVLRPSEGGSRRLRPPKCRLFYGFGRAGQVRPLYHPPRRRAPPAPHAPSPTLRVGQGAPPSGAAAGANLVCERGIVGGLPRGLGPGCQDGLAPRQGVGLKRTSKRVLKGGKRVGSAQSARWIQLGGLG